MLRVHNIRLGHANNSSSSHSVFLLPPNQPLPDDDTAGTFAFGWDTFTASTPESKARYLAACLTPAFSHVLGGELAARVLTELLETPVPDGEKFDIYVDHQSTLTFPKAWGSSAPDLEFIKEFRDWLLNDRVVVIGGNDNGGEFLPDWSQTATLVDLPLRSGLEGVLARKDPKGFWTLYNPHTGGKMRLAFDGTTPMGKSTYPELVDLKITDACPFGCEFCYQSSTVSGKDMDHRSVWSIMAALGSMQVFEVAIGGGEPTMSRAFVSALREARVNGITPNFTTRSLAWLKDETLVANVAKYAGSFAFSVHDVTDIEKLYVRWSAVKPFFPSEFKPTVQCVLGVVPLSDLPGIVEACAKYGFRLTLLGYKTVGMGAHVTPRPYETWPRVLKALAEEKHVRMPMIAIDTALAAESEALMQQIGIPDWSYHVREGAHSMYIDGVTSRVGPSSYGDPESFTPVNNWSDLPTIFATYPGE